MKKIEISNGTVVNWLIIAILIIAIFAIYTLGGCMSAKKINKFKQKYCKDSVSVVIKDRIVKMPVLYQDSAMLDLWMECDSCGNVYFNSWQEANGKYIELKKKLEGNKLTVVSYVHIKDTVFTTVHDTIKYQQANVVTNELTKGQAWWIRTGKWSFSIAIILLVMALVYTFFRFKSRILGIFKK